MEQTFRYSDASEFCVSSRQTAGTDGVSFGSKDFTNKRIKTGRSMESVVCYCWMAGEWVHRG